MARVTATTTPEEVVLTPIGVVRSPFDDRLDAPRQPRAATEARGVLELFEGCGFEDALSDLERWEYAWVIFVFDRNADLGWRPKVLPPRSDIKRGVFATRSPHRPNPIGLSVVRIESVDGLTVEVSELDILDRTPVLDIKPYLAWADAIPSAGAGWLGDGEGPVAGGVRPPDPRPSWEVTFASQAREQIDFLANLGVHLEDRIVDVLSLGPQPHAYRRIKRGADGIDRLAIGEWRARFRSTKGSIEVLAVSTGYRPRELHGDRRDDPALDVHRAFVAAHGFD